MLEETVASYYYHRWYKYNKWRARFQEIAISDAIEVLGRKRYISLCGFY
jgi:hypothetical protein